MSFLLPSSFSFGFSFGCALSWSLSKAAAASSSERSRTSTGSSSQWTGLSTSTRRKVNFFVSQKFLVADVCYSCPSETRLLCRVKCFCFWTVRALCKCVVRQRVHVQLHLEGIRFYGPSCLAVTCLVSVPSEEYRKWDSMRVDFRIVSVFCLRGSTAKHVHETVLGFFGLFPMLFYVQVDLACRGPCSVSWCRLRSTEQMDSGLFQYSVFEMIGQRIQFTRQSIEAWEQLRSVFRPRSSEITSYLFFPGAGFEKCFRILGRSV